MTDQNETDLLDYEDEEQTDTVAENGDNGTVDKKAGVKGNYVSIHSSGKLHFAWLILYIAYLLQNMQGCRSIYCMET